MNKTEKKQVQVMRHENCRFTITWNSYSVKSYYFNTIFNLLRLLKLIRIIIIVSTIQLLSKGPRKRGGKRDARYERTRITLRIEETSSLRVITIFWKNFLL